MCKYPTFLSQGQPSPHGRGIGPGSNDETVQVWRKVANRWFPTILKAHTDWVMSCAVSADGKIVISASDKTVRVRDIAFLEGAYKSFSDPVGLRLMAGNQYMDEVRLP